jgi:chromosomal replication initiation ATPase DnaA
MTPREERLAVIESVAAVYDVPLADVMGRTRMQPYARVRQIAMRVVADVFGDTPEIIGRLFQRDRSTVAHALRVTR